MAKELAILAALMLAGCQTPGGSFCRVMTDEAGQPIVAPTAADIAVMSDQLARGLTVIFETGERECGWAAADGAQG